LIYRRTGNLRAVQLLLGHSRIESTVRYLGIEVDDALSTAEQVDVCEVPGQSGPALPPRAQQSRAFAQAALLIGQQIVCCSYNRTICRTTCSRRATYGPCTRRRGGTCRQLRHISSKSFSTMLSPVNQKSCERKVTTGYGLLKALQ
jgi:hypothetical protein